jgi:uncharacterized repeat protein (TIGR03803 family)
MMAVTMLGTSWVASAAQAAAGMHVIYQAPASGDPLIATFANADGSVFVETPLGPNGHGQILVLTPSGGKYTASLVKAFNCDADGAVPSGSLVADASGNVWGMTNSGCGTASIVGTLFELVKPQSGGSWTFRTVVHMPTDIGLHNVYGSGYQQMAFDRSGDLYGLVALACDLGCGKVFRVPADAINGTKPLAKVTTLYTFPNTDNGSPMGLARDAHGNLFGTEYSDAPMPYGSVWALSPPSGAGASWTFRTIHQFCTQTNCPDGYNPNGVLAVDGRGDVFGSTYAGGADEGAGTIYSLTPAGSGNWTFQTLHVLSSPIGQCQATTDYAVTAPFGQTLLDASGKILTAVQQGGYFDPCGTDQIIIRGGVISVDPASGADAIASNQFAIYGQASGPQGFAGNLSIRGNVVYGSSQTYYDAATDGNSPGVVFKITP